MSPGILVLNTDAIERAADVTEDMVEGEERFFSMPWNFSVVMELEAVLSIS